MYVYGAAPRPPVPSGFLWSHRLGRGLRSTSSIAIDDGVMYLGANESLMALDLVTQEVYWAYTTGDMIVSSPSVLDSVIYFGSQNGSLNAVDRATGELLWSYATEDQITSSPAVADGVVFIGSHDGTVYAFE